MNWSSNNICHMISGNKWGKIQSEVNAIFIIGKIRFAMYLLGILQTQNKPICYKNIAVVSFHRNCFEVDLNFLIFICFRCNKYDPLSMIVNAQFDRVIGEPKDMLQTKLFKVMWYYDDIWFRSRNVITVINYLLLKTWNKYI